MGSNKEPAAQFSVPGALRLLPPLTEDNSPLAVLNSPPLTVERLPLAVLPLPPLTVAALLAGIPQATLRDLLAESEIALAKLAVRQWRCPEPLNCVLNSPLAYPSFLCVAPSIAPCSQLINIA